MARNSRSNGRARSRLLGTGLTRDQLALIHVARRELHLEEDEYRQVLMDAAGVSSSKHLDAAGFTKVLERLKAIGFVHRPGPNTSPPRPPAPSYGSRPGMATDAQIELIARLWATWAGSFDERAMNHWIERSFGVTTVRFARVHVAQQAIDGLRAMLARRAAPSGVGKSQ